MARQITYQIIRIVTCGVIIIALICGNVNAQEYNGYSQQISPTKHHKKDTVIIDTVYLSAYYRLCKLYGITPIIYRNEKVDALLKRYQGNYGAVQLIKPLPNIAPKQDSVPSDVTESVANSEIGSNAPHRMVLDEGTSLNSNGSKNNIVVENTEANQNSPEVVDQLTSPEFLTPVNNTSVGNSNTQIVMEEAPAPILGVESHGQADAIPVRKTEPQRKIKQEYRDTMANPIDQNRRNLMKMGGGDTRMYVPEEQVGIRVEMPKNEEPIVKSSEQKARPYPSSFLSVSGSANEEQDVVGVPLGKPNKPKAHNIYMPTAAPNVPVSIEQAKFDEELNFVVQIAACKKPLTPTYLAQLYKNGRRLMVLQEGGWYKYFIVSSGSYEYAKKSLKAVPVDGAFIAAYTRDGTKQALWQAKQDAKQKQVDGDMTYVVQLAASRKPASNFELRRLYAKPEKIIVIKEGGWYKYQLSFGNSLDEALAFKKTLKYNEESFITGYDKNGVAHMIK